jgi:spermidine/putrescine transport system ATP-binding protein
VTNDFDIAARGVAKQFPGADRRAVDDVTLEIRRGEFFSLLGPSGCGKSTLMRIVAGFETPDAGTVELGGQDMRDVPPHRRDVNMVFQNYALFPHLDVAGNVAFGLPRDAGRAARIAACLTMVNLSGYEPRAIATLSGGEQQRVAIARAVAPGPRVLLLDEPLGALDLKLRKGLQEELRRLQRSLGMTFLHVTHDQEEALALSDRIAVMNRGRVEQVGTPREIYETPATRFVAGFVGSANFFEGSGDGLRVTTPDGFAFDSAARGDVVVMVRPENVRLGGGVAAVVDDVLYQGSVVHAVLKAGARTIVAEGDLDVRPGQDVAVSWKAEDVRVFPR